MLPSSLALYPSRVSTSTLRDLGAFLTRVLISYDSDRHDYSIRQILESGSFGPSHR